MAIIGSGGRFTGSNPAYTTYELNHHVRASHAKYIISEPSMLSTVHATSEGCRVPPERIFVYDSFDKTPYDQYRSWKTLLHHGEDDWITFEDRSKDNRSTIATLAFTSGTTGLPKAAMISHYFSVCQIHAIRSHSKPYEVKIFTIPAP